MEYWEEVQEKIMKATPEERKAFVDEMEWEVFSALSPEAQKKFEDFFDIEGESE